MVADCHIDNQDTAPNLEDSALSVPLRFNFRLTWLSDLVALVVGRRGAELLCIQVLALCIAFGDP